MMLNDLRLLDSDLCIIWMILTGALAFGMRFQIHGMEQDQEDFGLGKFGLNRWDTICIHDSALETMRTDLLIHFQLYDYDDCINFMTNTFISGLSSRILTSLCFLACAISVL